MGVGMNWRYESFWGSIDILAVLGLAICGLILTVVAVTLRHEHPAFFLMPLLVVGILLNIWFRPQVKTAFDDFWWRIFKC